MIAEWKNTLKGPVIVVACGPSAVALNSLYANTTTFACNDATRFYPEEVDPMLTIVLDPAKNFRGDRKDHILVGEWPLWIPRRFFNSWKPLLTESDRSITQYNFTQKEHPNPLQSDRHGIPTATTTPYAAACLAFYMGARVVALTGVDLPPGHTATKEKTFHSFTRLHEWAKANKREFYNLSEESALMRHSKVPFFPPEEWE